MAGVAGLARYEYLPTDKLALDAAVHFQRVLAGFSRDHKYTLVAELRSQSRAVVVAIGFWGQRVWRIWGQRKNSKKRLRPAWGREFGVRV